MLTWLGLNTSYICDSTPFNFSGPNGIAIDAITGGYFFRYPRSLREPFVPLKHGTDHRNPVESSRNPPLGEVALDSQDVKTLERKLTKPSKGNLEYEFPFPKVLC